MGARDVLIPNLDCLSAELWRPGRKRQCPPPPRAPSHPSQGASCLRGFSAWWAQRWGFCLWTPAQSAPGASVQSAGQHQPPRGVAPVPAFWAFPWARSPASRVGQGLGPQASEVLRNLGRGRQTPLWPRVRVSVWKRTRDTRGGGRGSQAGGEQVGGPPLPPPPPPPAWAEPLPHP